MPKKIILTFFLLCFVLSPELKLLKAATCCNSPCCQNSSAPCSRHNPSDQPKRYNNSACPNCFKAEPFRNDSINESKTSLFKPFYTHPFVNFDQTSLQDLRTFYFSFPNFNQPTLPIFLKNSTFLL